MRSTSPTSAAFEASGARWRHRLAGEQPADGDAVEAAGKPAVVGEGLDAVRPAQLVQATVGVGHPRVDPAAGTPGIGAAGDDRGEGRVDADLVAPQRAPQRPGDPQPLGRQDPARVGGPPDHRLDPVIGIGNTPAR
jgi:hypothetical protein